MSLRRRLFLPAVIALALMALLGVVWFVALPKAVDPGLRRATKRTPYRLTYARKSLTWPPALKLEEVSLKEKGSGRVVVVTPSLSIGFTFGADSAEPRLLVTIDAPEATLRLDGSPSWPEDQARAFLRHALQNFRSVGVRWGVGRVVLEGPSGRRLSLGSVRGLAYAQGLDTFQVLASGTIDSMEGGGPEAQGPFVWSLLIQRYVDRTTLEHRWEGGKLRVVEAGRVVKKAGDPWQVTSRVPWLITFPIGDTAAKTAMTPDNPALRSLWAHLGSFF